MGGGGGVVVVRGSSEEESGQGEHGFEGAEIRRENLRVVGSGYMMDH
jgi:hypothetical protein